MTAPVVSAATSESEDDLVGLPLGPDSLTWKHFADMRGLLIVGRTGVLQTMHPTISQALVDHSDYFGNPLDRILRSSGPILGVIYDHDVTKTATWVRDQHREIKGKREDGKRYHALDPEAFFWAHATFFESQIARNEVFGTPLTEGQKRQLYGESITWYARYGLTMRPVPRDYDAFKLYWARMFNDVLQATPVAMDAMARPDLPSPFRWLDGLGWKVAGPLVSSGGPWVTRGTLPQQAREILGLEWSARDELALRAMRTAVRVSWPLAPAQVRRLERARVAERRLQQEERARARGDEAVARVA